MPKRDHLGKLASLWLETAPPRTPRPPLRRDIDVDVVVLGAGIAGLTAATLLARDGASVAVLERRHVAAGASGFNTAKLSSLHGLTYSDLIAQHGEQRARLYGEANEAGIALVGALAGDLGVECEFERRDNVVFTEDESQRERIEREVEAALRLGLPASFAETVDLPLPVAGAVRFSNQAAFHPVKYLNGLAAALDEDELFEGTTAVGVERGSPARVHTDAGHVVTAGHVVVATHTPFLDRGLFFARMHAERSYAVAARVPAETAPVAMYLSTASPAWTVRAHTTAGDTWLVVGGYGHKAGQADERERYARLADDARARFGLRRIELRWATQDAVPVDKVPFVGPVEPLSRNIHVATGFRKWGLAMGTAAGALLSDAIAGRENPWARVFSTSRLRARAGAVDFARENANVGWRFVADRVRFRGSAADLEPGAGRVVGDGLAQRALFRDDDGTLHSLSARCTHLGCIVKWNAAERTWDCPCHGSRFSRDGRVIEGPATSGLPPRPAPGEG